MPKEKSPYPIGRRKFLQNSAAFAASATLMSLGGYRMFGAVSPLQAEDPVPSFVLNNGLTMPVIGFGTHSLRGADCERYVSEAISMGYRLLDTATVYGNEEHVGAGIRQSGIDRKELFVTSKLWVDDSGYEGAKKAFQTSLDKLGLDYLDLYLIHRPRGDLKGSWKAMEELYEAGRIKAIGVSNFEPEQIIDLMQDGGMKPAVNQIETHVFFQQEKARQFLSSYGIQMEAWSPFAAGRNGVFTNETLAAIGKKYDKTNAQVCLRWHFQRGIVSIPRSSQRPHMMENLQIFDFELDEADMETIATLDLNTTQFPEWG